MVALAVLSTREEVRQPSRLAQYIRADDGEHRHRKFPRAFRDRKNRSTPPEASGICVLSYGPCKLDSERAQMARAASPRRFPDGRRHRARAVRRNKRRCILVRTAQDSAIQTESAIARRRHPRQPFAVQPKGGWR